MGLARRLLRGTALTTLAYVVQLSMLSLGSIVLARLLGPSSFGTYSLLLFAIGILTVVGNLGLPTTMQKYVSEFVGSNRKETIPLLLGFALRARALLTPCVIGILVGLAAWYITVGQPLIATYLLIVSVASTLDGFASIWAATITGFQRFDVSSKITLLVSPTAFVVTLASLLFGAGILGVFLVGIAISGINLVLLAGAARKILASNRLSATMRGKSEKAWLHFSLSILAIGLVDTIVWQRSEILFLRFFWTPIEVAQYSVAYGLSSRLLAVLPAGFFAVLFPLMSELYGSREITKIANLYVQTTRLLAMLVIPVCVLGIVLADPLIELLYGEPYLASVSAFRILLVSSLVGVIAGSGSSTVYATNRASFIMKFGAWVAFLDIVLSLALIPRFGILGAAAANFMTQLVGVVGGSIFVIRAVDGVRFPLKQLGQCTAAALVAALPPIGFVLLDNNAGLM